MTDLPVMLVPAIAMALLHFLWQGAVAGLLAWLALSLLRNARPQARYAVACIALLTCALLPVWNVWHALSPGPGHVAPAPLPAASPSLAPLLRWMDVPGGTPGAPPDAALPWIVALWAAGALLLSLRLACGAWWIRKLCRGARPDAGDWQACTDRLARCLRISRAVALRLVDAGDSPMTAGWWRPVVLLPVAVVARMPAELLEALVAHELAHVRRHDYLVNLMQGVVEALLFYHPVVWWLSRRIRIERELVADHLAAAAIGDPRRLAVALSELDRLAVPRSSFPQPRLALAAHGGLLMSRIRQLVRPGRQAIGAAAILPVLAVATAGVAFHAYAQRSDAPAPAARSAAPAPAAPPRAVAARRSGDDASYALVRKGRDGFSMSGHMDDIDGIRAAQRSIDADFVWFRRDGRAWIVRDAGTLARAQAAWKPTEQLEVQMQALDARMQPHSQRLEALGKQMESLHEGVEAPDMREASRDMEALAREMEAVARQQHAVALRQSGADPAAQRELEREMRELDARQAALSREMERHDARLEAAARRMEAQHAPIEALGREMEVAARPMEAIGKEMEALGVQIERQAAVADAEIRRIIDDAYRRGLATPAPDAQ